MLFAAGGQEFKDVRIERADWPGAHKAGTPFGQLPMLEADGVKLCQSNTCARFLARKFNLAGKNDLEQAQADMIVDCLEDSAKPILQFAFEKDEAKKAEMKKKFVDETLPNYFTLLEGLLKSNQGGDKFFVGSDMTWADIAFINFISWLGMAGAEGQVKNYPKLNALNDKVQKCPKIAEWIAKRPKTEF